jgi:hypothetical protein
VDLGNLVCNRLPETRTPDPLIKSQIQSGTEPNIDKKAQPFRGRLGFFFDNGRCMFCPGSGTKQAQPGSALALQAAFADIIHKKADLYITG